MKRVSLADLEILISAFTDEYYKRNPNPIATVPQPKIKVDFYDFLNSILSAE